MPKQISYGKVSFAIPYMHDYLNDHKAELETKLQKRSALCKTKKAPSSLRVPHFGMSKM